MIRFDLNPNRQVTIDCRLLQRSKVGLFVCPRYWVLSLLMADAGAFPAKALFF